MCESCGMWHCPPACPTYDGGYEGSGARRGHCAVCEDTLHEGERAYVRGKRMLCRTCAEGIDLDMLLFLEGADTVAELLCEGLGYSLEHL